MRISAAEETHLVLAAREKVEGQYTPEALAAREKLLNAYAPLLRKTAYSAGLNPQDLLSALTVAFLEQVDEHNMAARMATRMRWVGRDVVRSERVRQGPVSGGREAGLILGVELDTLEQSAEVKDTEEEIMHRRFEVARLLSVLSPTEERIIRLAYGFTDEESKAQRLRAGFAEDDLISDRNMPMLGIPGIKSRATAQRTRKAAEQKMKDAA